MATKKTSAQSAAMPSVASKSASLPRKLSSGKAAVEADQPEQNLPSLPDAALEDIIAPDERWLSPKALAAIFGVDEKWLSSVREGLKGIDGPPYKKLGEGRSAPIRYNYGKAKEWLDKFPSQINTHGKLAARSNSAAEFFADRDAGRHWLFAGVNGEPQDIIVAVNGGAFDSDKDPDVYWLTFWEWLAKAAQHGRMAFAIDSSLKSVSEKAIAILEDDGLRTSVPPGKSVHRPSIDDAKLKTVTVKRPSGL